MQELPLHRLSVSSLVELVGEVPGCLVGLVVGFDGLGFGLALGDVEGPYKSACRCTRDGADRAGERKGYEIG
jgi:hypothetical protein